jgi:hypothetical protein
MCDWCIPVLGSSAEKHQKEKCCFLQGAACPRCGPKTHPPSRCPIVLKKKAPIPSLKAEPRTKRPYAITNTNEAFVEYLKVHNLPIEKSIDRNRDMVTVHLGRLGCVPSYPPEPSEPSIPATLTECGCRHGGNEACMKQKRPQKAVATK